MLDNVIMGTNQSKIQLLIFKVQAGSNNAVRTLWRLIKDAFPRQLSMISIQESVDFLLISLDHHLTLIENRIRASDPWNSQLWVIRDFLLYWYIWAEEYGTQVHCPFWHYDHFHSFGKFNSSYFSANFKTGQPCIPRFHAMKQSKLIQVPEFLSWIARYSSWAIDHTVVVQIMWLILQS